MKPNEFAERLNKDFFGIETERFRRIVCGLRGHEYCNAPLYPDARTTSGVTAVQVAHLIRVLALNYNPFSSEFHRNIAAVHVLRDEHGADYAIEIGRLLSDPAEIHERGIKRISFSMDRHSVVLVSDVDQIFGDCGPIAFERYAILKLSSLLEISALLNKTQTILQP